jgi:hypothetical protein
MDLIRTALAHLGGSHATGAERYQVHLVADPATGHAEHLDGTPLAPDVMARVACDTAVTHHAVHHTADPTRQGRRTRTWSSTQRRTITVRDGGTCRFPGCTRTVCDIHHLLPWAHGGPTDIDNGLLVCARHHTLLHQGYTAAGDTNHTISFHRPDGTPLATTTPVRQLASTG